MPAYARPGARRAEPRVPCDVLRCGDRADAILGLGTVGDDLVASGYDDHLAGPERHRGDAVAHLVEPVERAFHADGVDSRDEEVGHQRLPAYLQPFGIAHRGVEPVEQLPASVAAQPPDDARGVHRFRVAERYYFRPFPLRDGFQHRERLGGVLHRFSLKVVSP